MTNRVDDYEDLYKVLNIEYDGTIESYNDLVDYLWDKESMHIWHLDDKGRMTPKFTGTVSCAKSGRIYRPGDNFCVDIGD